MEIVLALSTVVGGTLASELATIANKVTMTIGRGGQDEVVRVAFVLAGLREVLEVSRGLRLGLAEDRAATTTLAVREATRPPGVGMVPTEATAAVASTSATLFGLLFLVLGFRGLLEVET